MIDLFAYQDYRVYLRDYYKEQKSLKKNFSYKYFSEKAGIAAQSFLFHVIEGKRNLTKSTILKISQAIGHSEDESTYFENLVFFNQVSTINEKITYYNKLIEIRKPVDITTVDKDRFEYYNNWYHSVIREIVTFYDFGEDYDKLGAFLLPPIKGADAKKSVELLLKLGFIERGADGCYHQIKNLIRVKVGQLESVAIEKFQIEMLKLAMKAYDTFPVSQRLSKATTFSISDKVFELFKMRIRELYVQLMEMAQFDDNPSQVYQLNMNLFPISQNNKDHDEKSI